MKKLRLLTLFLVVAALFMAPTFAHAQKDYDDVLDKGLSNDEPYSYSLVEQSEGMDNRVALLKEALRFSPDVPALYFELSWASLPNVFDSLQYLIGGLKSYARNFWWQFSLAGLIYASLIISLFIAAAVVALIRLPAQIPLLVHDINEGKIKLVIPLILLIAALGGPLFFIAGALAVINIHLKKINKIPTYIVIVVLAASPVFVKFTNSILAAASDPELRAVVAVNEGRDNGYAIRTLNNASSATDRFSYALALKRTGRYAEAIDIYSSLAAKKPDWMVLNNLANAYAAQNQPDKAKETYQSAAEMEKPAVLLYNLSQIYRGTLNYSEGDKYYQEASAKNRDLVSKYTAVATEHPNRFVIDVAYSTPDFWGMAFKKTGDFISLSPLGTLPSAGLAVLLLVLALLLGAMVRSKAFRCSRCSKIVCNICSRDSRWGQMCPECYGSLVKVQDADRKQRVSALLAAYEHKDKIKKVVRILSFLPPGIAQISVGRTLSGFIFLWVFSFCAVAFALNPLISTGLAGFAHSWLNAPLIFMMVVLYLASTIYVNGRLESGWL